MFLYLVNTHVARDVISVEGRKLKSLSTYVDIFFKVKQELLKVGTLFLSLYRLDEISIQNVAH